MMDADARIDPPPSDPAVELVDRAVARPRAERRASRLALAVSTVLGLLTGGCSSADTVNLLVNRSGFETQTDIPYGDNPRLKLDVYRPRNAVNAPVVVFFYGGSWQTGSKSTYLFVAAALANRGFVTIVPDYRVYPEVRFPGFLQDGARAVRWAHDNAGRFGGDPSKLVIMGHSAGAHIAAMLSIDGQWLRQVGLDPRRDVAGLVGLAGPYDFLPLKDPTLKVIFGGDNRPATQPISFVKGGEPPALLLTGAGDETVQPGNTARLAARLRAVGSQAADVSYPRIGHITIIGAFSSALRFLAPVVDDTAAFIDQVTARRRPASSARKDAADAAAR